MTIVLFLTIVFVCGGTTTPSNAADKPIKWKMTTTWTPTISLIEADRHFAKLVNELSDGQLQIKFFDGGALVPPFGVFDAVQKGTIHAGGDAAVYWSGRNTAFGILCQMPLGPSWIDYMIWIYQGDGFDLYQEIFGKFGMVYLPHGVIPPESGLRGNKPIRSIKDFKGLKVRMSGQIQGLVLKDIGASQVMLAGGEVYQALEKGVIDGGEFSGPGIDWGMNFQEVTTWWAAPGWHQPGTVLGVMINKKAWDKLSDHLKLLVKTAAQANFLWSSTYWEYSNIYGTKKFLEKGIKVTRLPPEEIKTLEEIRNKHVMKLAKENPDFAKVLYSQFKFLDDLSQWREFSSPFSYGRNQDLPDLDELKSYMK
jgi:TRAP-type mannitol/chloroaromatic compound transport system substrate-binding protein